MAKIWKMVVILAAILLVCGLLLGGAGLLTGASAERVRSAMEGDLTGLTSMYLHTREAAGQLLTGAG